MNSEIVSQFRVPDLPIWSNLQISVTLQIKTKDNPSSNRHYRLTICQSFIAKPTIVNHSFLHAAVNHLQKIFTFSNVLAVDAFVRVGQNAVLKS